MSFAAPVPGLLSGLDRGRLALVRSLTEPGPIMSAYKREARSS